jgi:hypothetical protein
MVQSMTSSVHLFQATTTLSSTFPLEMLSVLTLLSWILACPVYSHSTWCGKYYEIDAPRTPPDPASYFQPPPTSELPLLDFRCHTASSLYLPDDDIWDPPAIIFDANITYDVGNSCTW